MKFLFTLKSGNRKTGEIPVTTSSKLTCPNSCSLKNRGCYADTYPLILHWNKLSREESGVSYKELLQKVSELPDDQFWRHNQAGDLVPLKKEPEKINRRALFRLVKANKNKPGFTYTHYPVIDNEWNREQIKFSNKFGFTINLSGDDPPHADKLYDLNIGPVTTLLSSDFVGKKLLSPAGRKIIICPAYWKDITCLECQLCAKQRKVIIGFPAHGVRAKQIDKRIKDG